MVALETPVVEIDRIAPDFNLKGVDGKFYNLESVRGKNGLVIMFICNHCPFVKAVSDRIARDTAELKTLGINSIAIMSNDVENYPDDSYSNMQKFARAQGFDFPYVIDETQNVAKDYGAVCTPDFFGFDKDLKLQYRGRLDESRMEQIPNAKRDLFEAMKEIAATGKTTLKQYNSIGCNIKWKSE